MYSELNFMAESWLKVKTDNKKEAIQNNTQRKTAYDYQHLMTESFLEYYRILKPGKWMTVEFSNTSAGIWNAIQNAIQKAGFIIRSNNIDNAVGKFEWDVPDGNWDNKTNYIQFRSLLFENLNGKELLYLVRKSRNNFTKIIENVNLTHGLIYSQSVLLALAKKGISREKAYEIVQKAAMECWKTKEDFKQILMRNKEFNSSFNKDEINSVLSLDKFTDNVDAIFSRVFNV